jgi:hypothetical protein
MQGGRKEESNFPPASTVKRQIILSHFVGSRMLNVKNASNLDTFKIFARTTPQMGSKHM